MKNINNLEDAIENNTSINKEFLLKKYPWSKAISEFLFSHYQIDSHFAFEGFVNVNSVFVGFADYLDEEEVLIPDVVTIVDFLSSVELSLLEIKKCVPIMCDFTDYCQEHYDVLFGGALKDIAHSTRITISGIPLPVYEANALLKTRNFIEEEEEQNNG